METNSLACRSAVCILRVVESCVFTILRKSFCFCSRDITALTGSRSSLVIAPHPDDEVLGCGTAIMCLRQAGQPVRVVFVTDGRHSHRSVVMSPDDIAACREVEALKACSQLGVDAQDVVFLRHTDGDTAEHIDKIAADLQRQIENFRPGCLFSPFGIDSHSDHRSTAIAVARLAHARIISCPIYEYPVWFWSFDAWRDALFSFFRKGDTRSFDLRSLLRPRTVAAVVWRDRKRLAFAEHRSQIINLTGEPTWRTLPSYFLNHFFDARELFFEKVLSDRT